MPRICAGDNLNLPFLGQILRWGGAFFIRRSFLPDGEYGSEIKSHLCSMLAAGEVVELFIEGGRTRHGAISIGKRGILGLIAQLILEGRLNDVTVIPSAIDYETLATSTDEDLHFATEQLGCPKQPLHLSSILFIGLDLLRRNFLGMLGYQLSSQGRVAAIDRRPDIFINFAKSFSMKDSLKTGKCFESFKSVGAETFGSCAQLISSQVTSAQRSVSYISHVAVVAATLLDSPSLHSDCSVEHVDDAEIVLRFQCLSGLLDLIACLSPIRLFPEAGSAKAESRMVEDALCMLSRLKTPQIVEMHTRAIERLRLRHACGELLSLLVPYSIVAFVLVDTHDPSCIAGDSKIAVLSVSKELADVITHAFPGSDLSMPSLGRAHDLLVRQGGALRGEAGEDSSRRLLRTLRSITLPAFEATLSCYTCATSPTDGPVSLIDLASFTREDTRGCTPEASTKHFLQTSIAMLCSEGVFVEAAMDPASSSREKKYLAQKTTNWTAGVCQLMGTVEGALNAVVLNQEERTTAGF